MLLIRIVNYLACISFARGIARNSRKFVLEKDVQANPLTEPLDILSSSSLQACAAECSINEDCCSASYGGNSSCMLYKCCFPETTSLIGGKHLRKRANADEMGKPSDCSELPPGSDNGVYTIYPTDAVQVDVYCDMRLECNTGWTVVQRRVNGTTNFNVNWAAYKAGFGDLTRQFWIGNDILNIMTTLKPYKLRFDMEDANGETAYAEYDVFVVADESTQYTLSIGGYSGTAGDALASTYNLNGIKFTTFDRDNDKKIDGNCAAADNRKGAWWFRGCARANPNGLFKTPGTYGFDSIYWKDFRDYAALVSMSMKIKPY